MRDRQRLEHMLQAAEDALAFVQDRTRADLDHDRILQHALVHCVQVIGEAAARTTELGRTQVPDLPWPKMVGMRHILVHDYFRVDYDALWRVVVEHLPGMVESLRIGLSRWPCQD
jgi:uncharacterized protein with HEPN domain